MKKHSLVVSALLAAVLVGNDVTAVSGGAPHADVLLVRASPAVAPCVTAVVAAMPATSGPRPRVQTSAIGPVGSASGADVVVAAEQELTKVLEGGESAEGLDVDVATIPWVFVGKPAAGTDLRALARAGTRVVVFGGVISRYARQRLEYLPPERVRSARDASIARRLPAGELALVPLSLAGPGPVSSADVPPLQVRAVGVRGSERKAAARAFLEFLTGPTGRAAFGQCGRDAAR